MHKNTKIVCTLGPSSNSVTEITQLLQAGMNIARLNFSHGTYAQHQELIDNIRIVEKASGKRIGILQDLQGPKIRVGEMPKEGILLKSRDQVTLITDKIIGQTTDKSHIVPINYPGLIKDLKKGDTILLSDGLIELQVKSKGRNFLKCIVKAGGLLKSRQGLACPTASISKATITAKDKKDLKFGLKNNVDFLALSFVKSPRDIKNLRKLMGSRPKPIIAKVERHEAVTHMEEIVKEADGIMVARGDLGVDIAAEKVPLVQKRLISLANQYAKPVITATQVLQSMVSNARATRAEISDAANSVFDHTDAIMLSNETAVGKYPAKAAKTLTKVAATVEEELQKLSLKTLAPNTDKNTDLTCKSASELAEQMQADFIITYTKSGYTARQIAKHRLFTPIITITPEESTARSLTITWGLNQIFTHKITQNSIDLPEKIAKFLKKHKVLKNGHKVVIISNASNKEKLISTFTI